MNVIINTPSEIGISDFDQIIELIVNGGQINSNTLKSSLLRSDLVAYIIHDDKIICTGTLKNPLPSYTQKVFREAKIKTNLNYNKELGYIVTHPNYEGNGYCTKLLYEFFTHINSKLIYATTRKASIIHILNKFGFVKAGYTYNTDLNLLIKENV